MYESPINFVTKQIQTEIGEAIEKYTIKAIQECGVIVDKEELIKALNYDRQQYEKGYADAKTALLDTDEWCIDCKEYDHEKHCCPRWNRVIRETVEEVRERQNGKWIYCEDMCGVDSYRCDKCGFYVPWDYTHKFIDFIKEYHYCPSCGAKMEEEHD